MRRPRPSAATAVVAWVALAAAAAASSSPESLLVRGARNGPPPGMKKTGTRRKNNREKKLPLQAGSGNAGGGNGRAVVVQPEHLGGTATAASSGGNAEEDRAGEAARYGQNRYRNYAPEAEYYRNGQPLQSSSSKNSSGNNGSDNNGSGGSSGNNPPRPPPPRGYENTDDAPYERWLESEGYKGQQPGGREQPFQGGAPPRGRAMSYDEWPSQKYGRRAPSEGAGARGGSMDWGSAVGSSVAANHGFKEGEPSYEEWLSQKYRRAEEGRARGSGSSIATNNQFLEAQPSYEEWLSQRQQYGQVEGGARGSASSRSSITLNDRPMKGSPSPLDGDLDVVSGKQVILRPRLSDEADSQLKQSGLPPLGSAAKSGGPAVYYYDPKALRSPSPDDNKNGDADGAPELTLPEVVYDASGRSLPLSALRAGGRNEVFLEVKPKAVWGDDLSGWGDLRSALKSKFQVDASINGNGVPQSQDQLIVLLTAATMAVLVGALVAQRLRSRKMLEACLHPELDDDDDWEEEDFDGRTISTVGSPRYDKKFDVDTGRSVASSYVGSSNVGSSTVGGGGGSGRGGSPASGSTGLNSGFGALLGGRGGNSRYYGSGHDAGGLHWRGDAEKFDV